MPEIQLFEVWLIVPRDKLITKVSASIRPKENNSKVNQAKCVVQITVSPEGTELDDNSVLAPGVTSKT